MEGVSTSETSVSFNHVFQKKTSRLKANQKLTISLNQAQMLKVCNASGRMTSRIYRARIYQQQK
jgi:hypothetical protein